MILCIKNPKDSTKNLLGVTDQFSKAEGYKINIMKSVAFLHTNNRIFWKRIKENYLVHNSIKNNTILRAKDSQEDERSVHWKL